MSADNFNVVLPNIIKGGYTPVGFFASVTGMSDVFAHGLRAFMNGQAFDSVDDAWAVIQDEYAEYGSWVDESARVEDGGLHPLTIVVTPLPTVGVSENVFHLSVTPTSEYAYVMWNDDETYPLEGEGLLRERLKVTACVLYVAVTTREYGVGVDALSYVPQDLVEHAFMVRRDYVTDPGKIQM